MSDILVPIIVLMLVALIFWMGWMMGKSEYLHKKLKMEPKKSLEELEKELDEALEIEDYEAAIESYKQGLKIAEEDINLKFNLGVAYFKNNQFDEAKEMFNKIRTLTDLNMKRQIDGYMKIINKQ